MKTEQFLNEELPRIRQELKSEALKIPSFHFDKIDLSELLNHVHCEKIFYFKSKYEEFSFLGLGHSKTIMAQELTKYLEDYPQDFLTTFFQFEENSKNSTFILPEWIFVTKKNITELMIHESLEYNNYSTPSLFFNQQFELNHYDPIIPKWESYEEFPEHDQWEKMIQRCDQLFISKELEKIVLSRKKIFQYNELISPIAFFKAVMEKNNNAESSYAIFQQITFDKAFISLTPEKLFSKQDNQFHSISLAASAPRGVTQQEDLEFESLLNSNDKLIREHSLVTAEIVKKLKPFTNSIVLSPLVTMKLPYIQHRSVPIKAELKVGIEFIDLVDLLHPTPAVGGLPWEKAQIKISELEPYTRKSYAAPIGLVNFSFSELAVGIRCALLEGSTLTIFGGAGIVQGSNAEEEWIETGLKMNPFLKVINQ
jgi:menaquinone-specific isochorismate synthase